MRFLPYIGLLIAGCLACGKAPERKAARWTVEPGFDVSGKPAGALAEIRSGEARLGVQCGHGRLDVYVDPGVQSKPGLRGFPVSFRIDDRDYSVSAKEVGGTRLFIGGSRLASDLRAAKTLRVEFTPLLDRGPGKVTFPLVGVGPALDQLRASCPAVGL